MPDPVIKLPTVSDLDIQGPKPKVNTGAIKLPTVTDLDITATEGATGQPQDYNYHDFRFQPKLNADNILLRAQDQGKLEQFGKFVGNTAVNIVTGIGEMAGSAINLATQWGDDQNYSNMLTRQMEAWHNPFGDIYTKHPDKVWDMKDPAWWYNNLGQVIESGITFAIPGGEIAKGFEWAAQGAAGLMKLGKIGTALTKGAGQVASAATMGWMEGAQSGYRIYDQAYKTQYLKNLRNGMEPEEADKAAKHVASDAAATTVRMYTGLGAILNFTAFSPLFKKAGRETQDWLESEGARQAGESVAGWKSRLQAASIKDPEIAKIFAPRHGISSLGSEIAQEGSEEYIQGYFDATGEDIGNDKGRMRKDMNFISDFIDKTANQEGLLSFVLGGLGGGIQTFTLDNIPLHSVQKFDANHQAIAKTDANGIVYDKNGVPKFETQLVSSRTLNRDKAKQFFADAKDAIIKDIDWFQTKNKQMMNEKDPVRKESLRAEMFDVNNLNAVTSGLGDNWKQQYSEVRDIDNSISLGEKMQPQIDQVTEQLRQATQVNDPSVPELTKQRQDLLTQQASLMTTSEAMQRGYAKDMKDNWYKEQAQGAIQDLTELQKMWDKTQKNYGQSEDQKQAGLADYIFAHQADLYRNQKILSSSEADHMNMLAEYEVRHAGLNEDFDALARQYASDWDVMTKQRDDLKKDLDNIESQDVQDKYHGLDKGALRNQLVTKINALNQQGHELNTGLRTSFKQSTWYQNNPGKSYEDYYKALQAKFTDRNDLNTYKAQIEAHRERTEALNTKLNDILTTKGIINTIKKAQAQKRDLIKEMEERNKKDLSEANLAQRSDQASKNLQRTQLTIHERTIREEIAEVERRITDRTKQLATYQQQVDAIKSKTSLWKQFTKQTDLDDLKEKMRTLKYDLAIDKHRLATLQQALDTILSKIVTVDVVPDDEVIVPDPPPAPEPPTPEPPTPLVDEEPISSEEKLYLEALKVLPVSIAQVIMEYEMTVKAGTVPFKLQDILNKFLGESNVVRNDVFMAASALKDYLATVSILESEDSEEDPPDVPNPEFEEPVDDYGGEGYQEPTDNLEDIELSEADLVPESYKDSPETTNADIDVTRRVHKGKKATSGVTIMNASLQYIGYVDNNGNYRNVSPDGKLNLSTPEDILKPNKLQPGTKVTFRITEYNGTVNDTTGPNSFKTIPFKDFFDDKGEVIRTENAVGNIPIGIYDENDQLLGYLATQERLTTQYPDTDDFRNIAENVQQMEAARNLALRQKLVLSSKEGRGTIEIREKGPGSVIENQKKINDKEYQRTRKSAKQMLPGKLTMAIVNSGTAYEQDKGATTKELTSNSDELRAIDKAPVVLLPMANGQYTPSPLYMDPLAGGSNNEVAVNSIMRVLELSLSQSKEAIDERNHITSLTGFDVSTPEGMRSYINQYWTYTENFTEIDTMADPTLFKGKSNRPIFLFNITGTGAIILGTKFSARPIMFLSNKNKAQFREALKAGLTNRYKNVRYTDDEQGIKGINSTGTFNEVVYNGTQWNVIPHANYNEYIKSHATTFTNGTNKLKDGSYVYSANPQIDLDDSTLQVPKTYRAADIPVPQPNVQATSNIDHEELRAGAPRFFSNMNPRKSLQENIDWYTNAVKELRAEGNNTTADEKQALLDEVNNFLANRGNIVPATQEATDEDDSLAESLGIYGNKIYEGDTSITTSIQPSTELQPISLDNLTELYNFTPSGERNGLTPEQVLERMVKDGIPYIAEGHNPFMKCN